jgi:pre-mRNA-processing factor 40
MLTWNMQNETRAARARSIGKVVALFKELDVDVLTRWRKAHELVLESEQWQSDAELRNLPTLDILLAFEDYSRVREREFDEQMRRTQVEKTRKERKAREGFKVGSLESSTGWMLIVAYIGVDATVRERGQDQG